MDRYIIALDIGTTSVRAILWSAIEKRVIGIEQIDISMSFPEAGYAEQDAMDIYAATIKTANDVVLRTGVTASKIVGVGITNQRETVVVWDKKTGVPVAPAISWQDRRTASICKLYAGNIGTIRSKTGLVLDPYFSASKLKWLFDNVKDLRARADSGEVLAGTLDTYIVWRLTQRRMHLTDMSNAARTQLFNINTLKWCDEIIGLFNVPKQVLPMISGSIGYFGEAVFDFGSVPIISVMGDQQSSLFGQACFFEGDAKHTYGTGGFMLANIGNTPIISSGSLLTTVAWFINGKVTYALEGSIFNAGSVIQYVRDNLKLIKTAGESETCALSVPDNGGIYFVPAFGGLGAPYWDTNATGNISGISRSTRSEHIVRAALESMAYGAHDLLCEFRRDDVNIKRLRVDGGACVNNFLLQFQADILNMDIVRAISLESTAQGAIFAAAFGSGIFRSMEDIKSEVDCVFSPKMEENIRKKNLAGWAEAVGKSRFTMPLESESRETFLSEDAVNNKATVKTKSRKKASKWIRSKS